MTLITPQKFSASTLSGLRAGAGPRLVFIHGVGLRAATYRQQIEAFAQHFEVVAVDVPGHGESHFVQGENVSDYAAPFHALIDRPTVVIGHSLGALIALELAMSGLPNLKGAIGLNIIYERSDAAREAVKARARELQNRENDPEATLSRWYGNDYPELRDETRGWLLAGDAGYRNAYYVFANYESPSREALSSVQIPMAFITGRDDPNSTPEMSQALAEALPNATAHIIEGAAHMAHMTHADDMNAAISHILEAWHYDN